MQQSTIIFLHFLHSLLPHFKSQNLTLSLIKKSTALNVPPNLVRKMAHSSSTRPKSTLPLSLSLSLFAKISRHDQLCKSISQESRAPARRRSLSPARLINGSRGLVEGERGSGATLSAHADYRRRTDFGDLHSRPRFDFFFFVRANESARRVDERSAVALLFGGSSWLSCTWGCQEVDWNESTRSDYLEVRTTWTISQVYW